MNRKPKVAVVYGGNSEEHEVSRASARSVLEHIDRELFDAVPIYITTTGVWVTGGETKVAAESSVDSLSRALSVLRTCDVVFPAMHGRVGEDGTLQALLELIDIPYVGSGVLASAVGMDKSRTKQVLVAEGLVVADGVVLTGETAVLTPEQRERLGLPVFVKPTRSGSSIGVSRVGEWSELDVALASARKYDSRVLVEAAVPGREIDVAVLERPDGSIVAGPPMEIRVTGAHDFFDYAAKYASQDTTFDVPAELDAETAALLQEKAVHVFRSLGCRGLLRVDFFLRADGTVVVNEVNTLPGLTVSSQFPQIWTAAGLRYSDLLTILVRTAMTKRGA